MSKAASKPEPQKWDLDRIVRTLIQIGIAIGVVLLLRFLSDVLIPFAIALLLAYLINPIVCFVQRKIKNRTVATLLVVFLLLIVFVGAILVLVPRISNELAAFTDLIRGFRQDGGALPSAQDLSTRYDTYVASQENLVVRRLLIKAKEVIVSLDYEAMVARFGKQLAPGVMGLLSSAVSLLLGLSVIVIILLYLIFLLIDYGEWAEHWKDYLPPKHRDRLVGFIEEFSEAMKVFFRGQFIVASLVGILTAFAFWLIDLRMGILLGLFIGALNMVPYLQLVGLVPALLLAVIRAVEHGSSIWFSVLLVLLASSIIQTIQDGLLVPLIMGKRTGLRPVAILLGIFVWGKLLGFLGLVTAIPLTCLTLAWYRRFVLGEEGARAITDSS